MQLDEYPWANLHASSSNGAVFQTGSHRDSATNHSNNHARDVIKLSGMIEIRRRLAISNISQFRTTVAAAAIFRGSTRQTHRYANFTTARRRWRDAGRGEPAARLRGVIWQMQTLHFAYATKTKNTHTILIYT